MKKTIATLTLVALVVACAAAFARASEQSVTLVIKGTPEADVFRIQLSPDGQAYEIESIRPLEVGEGTCWHPDSAVPTRLLCNAPAIGGFEINGNEGDDEIELTSRVPVPATVRGGPGADKLGGGGGADKLMGGAGADHLAGDGGDDLLIGGAGDDRLNGGFGRDTLVGGPGEDVLIGGPGRDFQVTGPGKTVPLP
jgi:hypothetical protein